MPGSEPRCRRITAADVVDILVAPPVPALLPEHRSLTDPVADLRAALAEGVRRLRAAGEPVVVVGEPASARVGAHLLDVVAIAPQADAPAAARAVLVLGNGSATRTEKAPGHFDDRAEEFDRHLAKALAAADGPALVDLDPALGKELWADIEPLRALGRFLRGADLTWAVETLYDAAPYGVQYTVTHLRGRPAEA